MRLHVLGHVDAHHGLLRAVVALGHGLGQLGLAHARRAAEDEGAHGAARVAQADARAAQRARDGGDGAVLSDDTLVQLAFEVEHAPRLVLAQLVDGHARPLRHHRGDVVRGHLEQRRVGGGGDAGRLLLGPALHLEALERADGGGLVDEVDGLVRQEAVVDVPVGELGGRLERLLQIDNVVVLGVTALQPTQDLHGLLHARLRHLHGLEAALEGSVLLNVLPVLGQGGRADALQLAARQGRLEDVGGVDGALGGPGADQGVQLINEEDRVVALGHLLDHVLQALLELAAVLGVGDEHAELEGDEPLVLEALRHLAVRDHLGEPLGDGGLAHARVAQEDRVVLAAAAQHLQAAAHLVAPSDDRVEQARTSLGSQVDAALRERRVLAVGPAARAHQLECLSLLHLRCDLGLIKLERRQQPRRRRVRLLILQHREDELLRAHELAALLAAVEGGAEGALGVLGEGEQLVLARRREEPVQRREGRVARVEHGFDRVALDAATLQRLLHRALLDARGEQQVLRLHLGAAEVPRLDLRVHDHAHRVLVKLVEEHQGRRPNTVDASRANLDPGERRPARSHQRGVRQAGGRDDER
mmetsp:Transcript_31540/g.74457  ORF Transcript_31540/g.74457 Transcript_31540/m.74457 type:complete len:588 (-) Transcript_31540:52-1815(-)